MNGNWRLWREIFELFLIKQVKFYFQKKHILNNNKTFLYKSREIKNTETILVENIAKFIKKALFMDTSLE